MAKRKYTTGSGYITLTGIVKKISGRSRTTHTLRIGFCGNIYKHGVTRLLIKLKERFKTQLQDEYPSEEYAVTVRAKATFKECDILMNELYDDAASN